MVVVFDVSAGAVVVIAGGCCACVACVCAWAAVTAEGWCDSHGAAEGRSSNEFDVACEDEDGLRIDFGWFEVAVLWKRLSVWKVSAVLFTAESLPDCGRNSDEDGANAEIFSAVAGVSLDVREKRLFPPPMGVWLEALSVGADAIAPVLCADFCGVLSGVVILVSCCDCPRVKAGVELCCVDGACPKGPPNKLLLAFGVCWPDCDAFKPLNKLGLEPSA